MNPNDTGSQPATPATAAPAAPTEGQQPTPAPSADPTPQPAAPAAPAASEPPANGEPAAPAQPATPPAPRESAMQKRAREAREKASGLNSLADRLDPQATPPAPPTQQPAAAAPVTPPAAPQTPQDNLAPDYFDADGNIDTQKHADWSRRVARAEAQNIVAQNDAARQAEATQANIRQQLHNFVGSVESEANELASTVNELNPNHADYDQALDDHITSAYDRMTRDSQGRVVRIDISLKEFAKQEVDMARRYRTNGAAAVPNTTAAQGQDQAIIPGGANPAPTKSVADMSAKEYEAHLKSTGVKSVQR